MEQQNSNAENKQNGLSWSTPKAPQAQAKTEPTPVQKTIIPEAPKQPAAHTATYVGMVVIGVIVGILAAWGWVTMRSNSSTEATSTSTAKTAASSTKDTQAPLGVDTSTVPALGSDPALSIMSPQKSGTSVQVDKAIVSAPTWVVIYEDKDGKPGNALGATLFFPEAQQGVVHLLRATVSGKSYLAAKQLDNGDRKFSLKGDQFVTENGQVQWVTFTVK